MLLVMLFEWVRNDRPRIGGIFDRVKATRKDLISAVNFYKCNRDKIDDDIIANSYCEKNVTQFWAEIKKRTKQLDSAPADGVKGNQNIADLLYAKYSSISERSNNDVLPHLLNSYLYNSRLLTSVITNDITQLNT